MYSWHQPYCPPVLSLFCHLVCQFCLSFFYLSNKWLAMEFSCMASSGLWASTHCHLRWNTPHFLLLFLQSKGTYGCLSLSSSDNTLWTYLYTLGFSSQQWGSLNIHDLHPIFFFSCCLFSHHFIWFSVLVLYCKFLSRWLFLVLLSISIW